MYKIQRNSILIEFDNENYVCSEKDYGTASVSHNSIQSYGQQGTTITYSSLNQRDIEITGYILAENNEDMRAKKNNLSVATNPLYDFDFIINDKYKLICRLNKTISYSTAYYENNEYVCKFMIDATCSMPYFLSTEKVETKSNSVIGNFHFPLIISTETPIYMGVISDTDVLRVNNISDIEVGCIITILATATISNPKILNMVTGEYIQLDCNIPAGYKAIINTKFKKKSVKIVSASNTETNMFQFFKYGSTFFQLAMGNNYFKFSHSTGYDNMSVKFEYTPSYLTI